MRKDAPGRLRTTGMEVDMRYGLLSVIRMKPGKTQGKNLRTAPTTNPIRFRSVEEEETLSSRSEATLIVLSKSGTSCRP